MRCTQRMKKHNSRIKNHTFTINSFSCKNDGQILSINSCLAAAVRFFLHSQKTTGLKFTTKQGQVRHGQTIIQSTYETRPCNMRCKLHNVKCCKSLLKVFSLQIINFVISTLYNYCINKIQWHTQDFFIRGAYPGFQKVTDQVNDGMPLITNKSLLLSVLNKLMD